MPILPTYPGVYIEEVPSGVRTITGVATSIAAFIGYFKRGPENKAVQIFNMGDFDREFGGLDPDSEAGYAIQQFFLNGGTQAHVVRVVSNDANAASIQASNSVAPGGAVIKFIAKNPGTWGNSVRVSISHDPPGEDRFNVTITEYNDTGVALRQEVFLNRSMTEGNENFIKTTINDKNTGSKIIEVDDVSGTLPPASNGTLSGDHRGSGETNETTQVTISAPKPQFEVTIDGVTAIGALVLKDTDTGGSYKMSDIAVALENAIRSAEPTNRRFSGSSVTSANGRLHILAGTGSPQSIVEFSNAGTGDSTADELLLTAGTGAAANVQEYALGASNDVAAQISETGNLGSNGTLPGTGELRGLLNDKSGIYALEDVDLFNILCIPRTATRSDGTFDAVLSEAIAYCEEKRAFFIIDTPVGIDDVQDIKDWKATKGNLIRSKNAALYFPRIEIPDALDNFRLRSVGASGTMAGLYARTDSNRGVWKAPAGTEASLRGVSELEYVLSDRENGVLNPLAINCLRNLPVFGSISWGARTMEGADALASEWKYVPVRRLALFLEESLFRGTHWVVFEPNDEPLWAQIRLNVGAFMNNLFKQGAFQGTSPREAYLVKCDKETTTQTDINSGIVNIVVGFAPLKAAEFVFIKIKQLAGQIET